MSDAVKEPELSDISRVRDSYFAARRAYGDAFRDVGEAATRRGFVGLLIGLVLLWVIDFLSGENFTPFRTGARLDGVLGLLILAVVIWGAYSGYKRRKLGKQWTFTFADFLTEQMELRARCRKALGGNWRLVYSNHIAPRENPEASKTVPLKAFELDGDSPFLLGGSYRELKPFEEPTLALEQVFIHDFEGDRLLTFSDGKLGQLVGLGAERHQFEFEGYPSSEQDSAREYYQSEPQRRWKKIQSFLPLSDGQVDFMVKSEGAILFGVVVLLGVALYMGWISL